MRRLILLLLWGALVAGPSGSLARRTPESAAPARRADRTLKVVELRGHAYARGLMHGRALKADIQLLVQRWKADLHRTTKADPDAFLAKFLRETDFISTAKRWTPDLLEEVRGIADGADLPFDTVYAFQLVDELWAYAAEQDANHCSTVGVARTGTAPAFVAQNMDLETFRDGFQAVLHIQEEGPTPEQFIFTCAGLVALNGMNNRAIGLVVNTLSQLRSSRDGLPVAFIVRGVLAKTQAEDAIAFLNEVKHASGQNYLLGAGGRVYDFEASADKVVALTPDGGGDIVYHTNHPLVNDNHSARYAAWLKQQDPHQTRSGDSPTRYQALEARFKKAGANVGSEQIKAALRSKDSERHPVCRPVTPDAPIFTFGSTIMTLSERPVLEVAMGPPDENPYTRFEVTVLRASKAGARR
jgi:isopenicillin-N N-acyltransferase-like protein